ncbi:hypothetical protein Lal_00032003 [Lupinus albus]|nr:hypothetical protein Lal_00032003 [Lupinus albus]
MFISAVYAHNIYVQRRDLWVDIQSLMDKNNGSWCCIGDFNVVLRAHEFRGPNLPLRLPSDEFKLFTYASSLIHLETRGADYSWTNRRRGYAETEKMLDRSFCNEEWMATWGQLSCSTLPRVASDIHPLLLCFSLNNNPRINSFKFHKMWLSHVDCHRVVAEIWRIEVKNALASVEIIQAVINSVGQDEKLFASREFGSE